MEITKHAVVSIQYELKNDGGEIIDASTEDNPLVYMQGIGHLIPGLESELEGKTAGDALQVVIAPADGYGELDPQLIQQVPMEMFAEAGDVQVGMQFRTGSEDDESRIITITEIAGDQVTIDANHPLAGEALHFSVSIESVREATEEEISHGHVH